MTPDRSISRLQKRVNEVEAAIPAPAARWGDIKLKNPEQWKKVVNNLINVWFPARSDIVVEQLKGRDMYPDTNPPLVKFSNTEIKQTKWNAQPGTIVNLANEYNSDGNIYYTLDGTDPRSIGGAVSPSAINGQQNASCSLSGITLKTRIKEGNTWSALREITLISAAP
ncbi:MAG: hypothetical protein GY847_30905 [Proteobacteria bacterium]|nr:hypothetical protein [Pseudomonadota bacterium]